MIQSDFFNMMQLLRGRLLMFSRCKTINVAFRSAKARAFAERKATMPATCSLHGLIGNPARLRKTACGCPGGRRTPRARSFSSAISSSTAFKSVDRGRRLFVDADDEIVAAQPAQRGPAARLDLLQQDALQVVGDLLVHVVAIGQFAGGKLEIGVRQPLDVLVRQWAGLPGPGLDLQRLAVADDLEHGLAADGQPPDHGVEHVLVAGLQGVDLPCR